MPFSKKRNINPDIAKERQSATFDVEEFAVWWHGGLEKLHKKRQLEKLVLEDPELQDEYPPTYMSYQDMYDNYIKKVYVLGKILRKLQHEHGSEDSKLFLEGMSGDLPNFIQLQGSPVFLHLVSFVPALKSHGTAEQIDKWLPRALNFEYIGTYAQTELGHGTYLRGLETRADYDPKTEEFVLNTPTLTSYKWWAGGLGHTVNYALVMAQLYINGKSHGIQMFLIQVRDEETHMPMPGIHVGDIGGKMGLETVNNGFLGFKDYRTPRMSMLMRHAQVLPDGTFKQSSISVLTYLTMVDVRVRIVGMATDWLTACATIATRYSAVRRQGVTDRQKPEHQIIDHVTQQMKIFPEIAKGMVLKIISDYARVLFKEVHLEVLHHKYDRLPELHALSCALKAIATKDSRDGVDTLRIACGGHGFLLASNLPLILCSASASLTFEGDNTVLLLQTARFLMKSWARALKNEELPPTAVYLADTVKSPRFGKWDSSPEGIVKALQFTAASKIRVAFEHLETRKKHMTPEEAANLTSIWMVEAAELHGRAFIAAVVQQQITNSASQNSVELHAVFNDLLQLYLVKSVLQNMGAILRFIPLTDADQTDLQYRLEELLARIRPNAVSIVDGFDYHDGALNSVLGAYDGNAYERIFDMAQRNPVNRIPVQKSYQEHLKPLMRSKF